MTTLLLGASGQLGRHLAARMPQTVTCARDGADHVCDLSDPASVADLLEKVRPGRIVNAAAWTAVDAAEDHPREAFRLNHDLPATLAEWCRRHDALLIHYSTDYVFSGNPGRPWREDDPVAPESVYGTTKLAGEQAVASSGCRALVLRTAWVYSALPGNFISAILRRAAAGEGLKVVSDQIGSPTWAGTLVGATLRLLESFADDIRRPTLLHVAGRGRMSWHELAVAAVQMAAERGIIPAEVAIE
ncbi:MAG: dTDP-4-dehydrorhamnose reductase, partial [Wenzhouxiangella sp.]